MRHHPPVSFSQECFLGLSHRRTDGSGGAVAVSALHLSRHHVQTPHTFPCLAAAGPAAAVRANSPRYWGPSAAAAIGTGRRRPSSDNHPRIGTRPYKRRGAAGVRVTPVGRSESEIPSRARNGNRQRVTPRPVSPISPVSSACVPAWPCPARPEACYASRTRSSLRAPRPKPTCRRPPVAPGVELALPMVAVPCLLSL